MNLTYLAIGIVSGVLPSILWLWFWLHEDNLHPEPRSLIVGTFIAGAAVVVLVLPLQMITAKYAIDESTKYMIWAGIEEVLKFLAAFVIAFRSRDMDEPIDAMIYMITAALGFAAVENILFLLGPLADGDMSRTIIMGNMRFIGATLVHVVCSATIGFFIGFMFYKDRATKIVSALIGIALAITLHSLFNLSIIGGTVSSTLKTFGWVWAGAVVIIILFEEVKAVRPKQIAERIFKI
jgi:RsiW-degrading membrane proteinase PrsW (M82 family)